MILNVLFYADAASVALLSLSLQNMEDVRYFNLHEYTSTVVDHPKLGISQSRHHKSLR